MYWMNIAEAGSQLLNAILGGNPNQTFSARVAANREQWPVAVWLFDTLLPGHLDWAAGPDE